MLREAIKEGLYTIFLFFLFGLTFPIAFFLPKLKKQILARKWGLSDCLLHLSAKPRILFLVSSAGEYEQAKPILQRLMSDDFFQPILIFNSVAGFEYAKIQREKLPYFCAPLDFPRSWRKLFKVLKPQLCVVIRHDLLPGFTMALGKKCPIWVANFHPPSKNQAFLKRLLSARLQNIASKTFLVEEVGDTKYDRVLERRLEKQENLKLVQSHFLRVASDKYQFLIGSAWKSDVERVVDAWFLLPESFKSKWQIIVAPHDLSSENIESLETLVRRRDVGVERIVWRALDKPPDQFFSQPFVILECMGFLAELYGVAKLAFVGGSVDRKIHNVLEPATYNVPLVCGPYFQNQSEASLLVELGLMKVSLSPTDLSQWWQDSDLHDESKEKLSVFIESKIGASHKVVAAINEFLTMNG